ncbi:MAG: chitobiase/beta-hexosaminidase C-terminal domain-containing protein, partial [Terracidiphilus sp.]
AEEWTWRAGSSTISAYNGGQPGSYGTLGSPGSGNTPGGRSGALAWADTSGNLWLFGGAGFDSAGTNGNLNDLWEFNPALGEWAWMGGAETVGASDSVAGFYGAQQSFTAGSYPGSRNNAATWTDASGNLWLFGGYGEDALDQHGDLNDLWEYSPTLNAWAWMSGGSTMQAGGIGNLGVYGQKGTAASGNTPGGRDTSVGWADGSGNLWLFGGNGFLSTANGSETNGFLNDLWKYDTTLKEWAWIGGSDTFANGCAKISGPVCGQPGVYGTEGTPSTANLPGARASATVWTDSDGNAWLFGGEGFDSTGAAVAFLNDLWKFLPGTGQWAWTGGYATAGANGHPGVYGTLGTASATNLPGGRETAVGWADLKGNLWLFGGDGMASNTAIGYLNDLWQYALATPAPQFSPAPGSYASAQSVTIADSESGAVIYYTTDGTSPTMSSPVYSAPIDVAGNETIEAFAVLPNYLPSLVVTETWSITEPAAATPTFTPVAGSYSAAQTVTIADSTQNATIYYAINATPTTSSTQYTGPIAVSASETIEAIAVASGSSDSAIASATYSISLPPVGFALGASPGSLTVSPNSQGVVTLTITPQNGFTGQVIFACSKLPAGGSCSFSPSSVSPSGAPASTQLTLTMSTASAANRQPDTPTSLPALALAALAGLFGWRKRRRLTMLAVLGAAFALVGLSGCSASLIVAPLPVTSTVTVTATSGALQQSAAIALTIK